MQLYRVHPGGIKNGKFVTLTPFQKNRSKSMNPPRPKLRKFSFKLSYSTTTTQKQRNFAFSRSIYLLSVSKY